MIYLRDLLITLSAFSIGSALFTAALALLMIKSNPKRYLSFAIAKIGYALVVGTILLVVIIPVPYLRWTFASVVYSAGLVLAGLGFMGVGKAIRIEFTEWEIEQEERRKKDAEA